MNEMTSTHGESGTAMAAPDREIDVRETFGIDVDWKVPAFSKAKTAVAALFVALNLMVGFLTDGHLTGSELTLLVIQVLATLGVAAAPAVSTLASPPTAPAPAKFSTGS